MSTTSILLIAWAILALVVAVWFGFIACSMRKDKGGKHGRH
jgi:hypothetical protein